MRKWLLLGIVVISPIGGTPMWATEARAPSHKVRKVAIVALARDAARAAEIESAVKETFTGHGVAADSLRTFARQQATTKDLADLLRSNGYDALLCMGPRKTIQIEAGNKTKRATMDECLSSFLSGNYPTGEPLDVYPVTADAPVTATGGGSGSLRSPIPSNAAAAPMTIYKGTLRFFDTATQELIWEGRVHSKMPAEMRSGIQIKVLAHDIRQAIEKSDLLP